MGHLGMLKAKLAKLKRELITPSSGGGGKGEGFDVAKTGDARIGYVSDHCDIRGFACDIRGFAVCTRLSGTHAIAQR